MILVANTHKLFTNTAAALSDADIQRMRDDAMGVLRYAVGESDDESYRPASLGWYGYEIALAVYGTVVGGQVWLRRIGPYNIWDFARISTEMHKQGYEMEMPPWIDDIDILQSHRSWLRRSFPKDYKKVFPGTPEDWPVLWPIIEEEDIKTYHIVVAKEERKMLKNLPKKVRKRVANA